MGIVLVVDSMVDDTEFVEDDHNQMLVHNYFLNASLDNFEMLVAAVDLAALQVLAEVIEVV
jgi:hypothetical protein